MRIVPAILAPDLGGVLEKVNIVSGLGCDEVQVDVMDGRFVPERSYSDPYGLRDCRIKIEAHLMVENALAEMARWRRLRNVTRAIIHWEASPEKNLDRKYFLSIALNPETPISVLAPHLDRLSYVLIMGVQPGGSGRPFQERVLEKVDALSSMRGRKFRIGFDGGVNRRTAPLIKQAGADVLNVASFLFKGDEEEPDIRKNYEWLKRL